MAGRSLSELEFTQAALLPLLLLLVQQSSFASVSCTDVRDPKLMQRLLKAAKPLVELRTQRELKIRNGSIQLQLCSEIYDLGFEEQMGEARFAWLVTFNSDFTKIRVVPPE